MVVVVVEGVWSVVDTRPITRCTGAAASWGEAVHRRGLVFLAGWALVLATGVPAFAQSPYVVIVHPDNPVSALANAELSEIFLKKKVTWSSGATIEPVDISGEADLREAFSQDVHGRSTAKVRSFWNQEVFSGRSVPPLELPTSKAVVDYVAAHPGAIGYISPQAAGEGVKILGGIVPPRLISRVEPNYTGPARSARVVGNVVLSVQVDAAGNVGNVKPVQELGFGLTNEAISAVKKWKFRPATRDGKPIPQEVVVTIRFAP